MVLEMVKIGVTKINKNVSKNNMSPKGECEAGETPMVQQPSKGPLKRKNIKAFDEPMLSSFKRSLTTNGTISICPSPSTLTKPPQVFHGKGWKKPTWLSSLVSNCAKIN